MCVLHMRFPEPGQPIRKELALEGTYTFGGRLYVCVKAMAGLSSVAASVEN